MNRNNFSIRVALHITLAYICAYAAYLTVCTSVSTAVNTASAQGNLMEMYREQNPGMIKRTHSLNRNPQLLEEYTQGQIQEQIPGQMGRQTSGQPSGQLISASRPTDSAAHLETAPADRVMPISVARNNAPYNLEGSTTLPKNFRDPLSVVLSKTNSPMGDPYQEMIFDAGLNDICFIDSLTGWSVGEHGAIWHTSDGGKNWTLQETPIDCTLYSVSFHDASFGLAVGGYRFPGTSQGRSVILITHDGGKNWSIPPIQTFNQNATPIIHKVKVIDSIKAWIATEASESFPSGIFQTSDAGKTWKPKQFGIGDGWSDVDFFDENLGFGIGTRSNIRLIRDAISLPNSPVERINGMKLDNGKAPAANPTAWIAGDSATVMYSLDRGLRWSAALLSARNIIDWNTIEVKNSKIWVAGNPGSLVFRSSDAGKTWQSSRTGVNMPIRKLIFYDENLGFAVGDFGMILNTTDGGASWNVQRTGGKKLSLLGFFAAAEDIPFEAFACLCAQQGYRGAATIFFDDDDPNKESSYFELINEAMLRCGTAGAIRLQRMSMPKKEIIGSLDKLIEKIQADTDDKTLQKLREKLVALIRRTQPEIVIIPAIRTNYPANDPLGEFVLREVMSAITAAEDPAAFPYHITELSLSPWKVRKVHLMLEDGVLGDVNVIKTDPAVRFAQSFDEMAFFSRELIGTKNTGIKKMPTNTNINSNIIGFSTPLDNLPPNSKRDFFAGIEIAPGSDGRRELLGSFADYFDEAQKRMQKRRQVFAIIENMNQSAKQNGISSSLARIASGAEELTRKIDGELAVQLLIEMGRNQHLLGDWESAREALDIIARKYQAYPAARYAFKQLLLYYASEEAVCRKIQNESAISTKISFDNGGKPIVSQTKQNFSSDNIIKQRLSEALNIGRYIETNFPELGNDAQIKFALASVQRRLGRYTDAMMFYKKRGKSTFDDVWGMRARTEEWLLAKDTSELVPEMQDSPMPIIRAAFTNVKPYLDGKFDKENDMGTWFASNLYSLTPEKRRHRLAEIRKVDINNVVQNGVKNGDGSIGVARENAMTAQSKNLGTQTMCLYDKEYIYIGIRSKKLPNFSYPPIAEKPRARDVSIDNQDRVEILFDVDRDYSTYYSITFDSRGWVVDSCWNDTSWNPCIYVARFEDAEYWYIESAIAIDSLSVTPPIPGTAWGVAVRRLAPGLGIECWNAENSIELSKGFGLLMFK